MSHLVAPRDHKVQKSRVAHITKGYATGGAVNCGTAPKRDPNKPVAPKVRATAAVEGAAAKKRADRPARANGGKVNGKATTVNVVVNAKPEEPSMMMAPPPPPMPPPGPPPGPPMAPPPGGPMAGPPPGLPPGPPMRKSGGRVKSGPAWEEGKRNGTKVQHSPGKNDLKEMGRGKPITYAKGGKVFSDGRAGKQMGPKMDAGSGSGEGRLDKAKRA
jgi:hypothetical protein